MSAMNHANDAQPVFAIVKKLVNERYIPALVHKQISVKNDNFPALQEVQTSIRKNSIKNEFSSGLR